MAKYLKPYCEQGFVEENTEIEYLKFNNIRHTILGCMLGDFNDQGIYTVSPDIVSELISMRKYIVDSMDNIDVCLSELKLDKQLTFMVIFEADRATLSLVEKINMEGNFKLNSGAYTNINEYLLDVVETSGKINRNAIYKKWNIGEFGGAVLDVSSMDEQTLAKYFNIVNRYKYLLVANTKLLEAEEQIEEVEADYALAMLESIKTYPKFYKAVMGNIKMALQEKKGVIRVDKPNFAKTLNEVIDSAVDEHISLLTAEEKKNFESDQHNAELLRNQRINQLVDIKKEEIEGKIRDNEYIETPSRAKAVMDVGHVENISLQEVQQRFKESRHKCENRLKEGRNVESVLTGATLATSSARLMKELANSGVEITQNMSDELRDRITQEKKEKKENKPAAPTLEKPKTATSSSRTVSAGAAAGKPTGIGFSKPTTYKPPKEQKKKPSATVSSSGESQDFITYPKPTTGTSRKKNGGLIGERVHPSTPVTPAPKPKKPKVNVDEPVTLSYINTHLSTEGTHLNTETTTPAPTVNPEGGVGLNP